MCVSYLKRFTVTSMGNTCCSEGGTNGEASNMNIRCDPTSEWATSIHQGDLDEIKAILEDTPKSLNSRVNMEGDTALIIAVRKRQMSLIEFLLFNNADVNIQSFNTGNTALHEAALRENVYILTMLIHSGADPKITNNDGRYAKSLSKDREIKSLFKPHNMERIRNQRSLRQLLQTPTALDNETHAMIPRADSEEFSETVSSSIIGSTTNLTLNESFIERVIDCDQGMHAFLIYQMCIMINFNRLQSR